jgi:dihydrofolate reductase
LFIVGLPLYGVLRSSAIKLSYWDRMNRIGKGNISEQAWSRERRMNLGKVRTGHSTSLDGFIAGPNDGPEAPMGHGGERLLGWYAAGDTEYRLPGTEMVFKVSPQTAELLRETRRTTGALVTGRRTFDLTNGWGGRHPLDVPVFVVSHTVLQEWVYEGSPFTFVTDGLQSALEQAKAVAGDKDVGVVGASLVQQCIRAGVLDEIHVDLVPVLLGDGVRLLDHLGAEPLELESTRVIEGAGVTHLTFRVVK